MCVWVGEWVCVLPMVSKGALFLKYRRELVTRAKHHKSIIRNDAADVTGL